MLSAIGIILILKQLPHLAGYDADYVGDESFKQSDSHNSFSGIFSALNAITPLALFIGVLSLAIQFLWDKILVTKAKIFRQIPAPLIVVLLGTLINVIAPDIAGTQLNREQLVSIPVAATATEFISFFTLPSFSHITELQVWITGLTLAIVASLETLLSVEAADNLDPYKRVTPTNRELKAQGTGNIISGLLGGLPVTSVIVRTSANINAGAKSKISAILHGVLLLLCVAFIPGILNYIPLSALAGVLIYTGYKLNKLSLYRELYRKGLDQFIPFIVTLVAIILTDLLTGIIIGIAVGLFFVMRSNFKTSLFVVHDNENYLFRLRKDVSFLNKPVLKAKLESMPENACVLIDLSRADFIDKDVIEVLNDFLKHAHLKNIKVEIKKSAVKPAHSLVTFKK